MPFDEVPEFMVALRERDGIAARALEFAILTAARSGEVFGASWGEFDLEARVWTVPAARMKAGREHRVPLSARAVEILREMEQRRLSDLVFPGTKPVLFRSRSKPTGCLRGESIKSLVSPARRFHHNPMMKGRRPMVLRSVDSRLKTDFSASPQLPPTGFVRLPGILAPNRPIPVSKSTWWAGIKDGRYPKPVKLGPRITAWRVEDIRSLISEAARS